MHPLATIRDGMWTRRLATGRCELLIAPQGAVKGLDQGALARSLACTLNAPKSTWTSSGPFLIGLAGVDAGDPVERPIRHRLVVNEGRHPDPLGLRIVIDSGPDEAAAWSVQTDHAGVRPLYYGLDNRHRPIVSTRPELIAALIGSGLSISTLAEQLVLGFPLDHHTIFEGVQRIRPEQMVSHDVRRGFRVHRVEDRPRSASTDPQAWIEALTPHIVASFERGDALELSGGIDSRLVLALGLAGGARPQTAFTLGHTDDQDVRIAMAVAAVADIKHVIIPAAIDGRRLTDDAWSFAERSGFVANACSYAWLPSAFSWLGSMRHGQIGGGGGECAAGFYDTPFDASCALPGVKRSWVQQRLLHRGVSGASLLGDERWRALVGVTADSVMHRMRAGCGSWRRRADDFYRTQRVPNAGGPVLAASACWYRPFQPLLSRVYLDWGRMLPTRRRTGRRVQRDLVARLAPALATLPYAGRTGKRTATARLRDAARRVTSRVHDQPRRPDLGAAGAAEALVTSPWVRESIEQLAGHRDLRLDAPGLARILADPGAHAHELGTLITAAWAGEAARHIAGRLTARGDTMARAA